MNEIYNKVCEIFRGKKNVSVSNFSNIINDPIELNINGRYFVVDKDANSGKYSLQENLEGYESNYDYLGIFVYETKQRGRIYSRLEMLANNNNAPILGAKLI